MSTPSAIARYLPRGSSAIQKITSCNEDGSVVIDEIIEKSIYSPVVFSENSEVALAQSKEYHQSVTNICNLLMIAFPRPNNTESEKVQNSAFYALLYKMVEKERIPLDRLKDSVENIIKNQQRYKSFNIADIINFDKKIILAKNKGALSRKLKRQILDAELAVTYEIVNGRVVRLLGLIEDIAESPQYKDRVLGVWDEDSHSWRWVSTVDDPSIIGRQLAFKKSLFKYCNAPGFNGEYNVEVVKSFYEYYSKIVPPGDMLLFETKMQFNIESWLDTWNERYYKNNNSN